MRLHKHIARLSVLLLLFAPLNGAAADAPAKESGTVIMATFNIRQLSDRSRNDEELAAICSILTQFDIIAVQEVKDTDILDRAIRMLYDQFGADYGYLASDRVGRGSHHEIYAFIYRRDMITPTDVSAFIPDPVDYFIREPFYAGFSADGFDFYLISVHLIYGNRKSDRRQEAMLLDDVYRYVQDLDEENDVILVGDFNLGPDDDYLAELRAVEGMYRVNVEATTIKERLYDNIWFQDFHTPEYVESGVVRFDEDFFDNDDAAASLMVSDHRPLWARFVTGADDD